MLSWQKRVRREIGRVSWTTRELLEELETRRLFGGLFNEDLDCTSVTRSASAYGIGDFLNATAFVTNRGNLPTALSTVRFFLSRQVGGGWQDQYRHIQDGSIPPLLAGGSASDVLNGLGWVIPGDVPAGTYRVAAKADWFNSYAESNEDNNWGFSASFTVSKPDLIVPSIQGVESYYAYGSLLSATANIRNQGTISTLSPTLLTGPFGVRFTLGTTALNDPANRNQHLLQNADVAWLDGGQSTTDSLNLLLTTSYPPGHYRVWAEANPDQTEVYESDYNNNYGFSAPLRLVDIDTVRWEDEAGNPVTGIVPEGSPIYLAVRARGFPTGQVFKADVFEDDAPGNDLAGADLELRHHAGDKWRAKWFPFWQEDAVGGIGGDPEYFFQLKDLPYNPGVFGLKSANINVNDLSHFGMMVRPHTTGTGVPLLLVHGNNSESRGASVWGWEGFLDHVEDHPDDFAEFDIWIYVRDTSLPIGFNGHQQSQAGRLSNFVYNVMYPGRYENQKLALVAHSQGGMLARSFMNRIKAGTSRLQGEDVSGLITLGTPHHGSPFAVTDWVAALWAQLAGTDDVAETLFEQVKTHALEVGRNGSINLAWDNGDGAIQGSLLTQFPDSSYTLTQADANVIDEPTDPTRFYPQLLKTDYGTLAHLNAIDAFRHKLVAIGAYDSDLSNNPDTVTEIVAALAGNEHEQLSAVTGLLALMSTPQTGSSNDSTYFANDGLVPLQSALFLDLAGNGGRFAGLEADGGVVPNRGAIDSAIPAGQRTRIYTGTGLTDHMDLLDTTNDQYWDALTSDLRSFLDFTAPAITGSSFEHHPPHRVSFTFSEYVSASLQAGDLVITNDLTGASFTASDVNYDPEQNIATFFTSVALPDGNYTATLAASAVEDRVGNKLAQDAVLHFFVLGGDADRDRTVGFSDLVAVAQNYGAAGKTWADGDFTGEGDVDFQDLVILAQRYGTTLPPTPPADPVPANASARRRQADKVFSVQPIARPRPTAPRPVSRLRPSA